MNANGSLEEVGPESSARCVGRLGEVTADLPLVQLVLAASVRPATAGLVSLAHVTPPSGTWALSRGDAFGGPQARTAGARVGGDLVHPSGSATAS